MARWRLTAPHYLNVPGTTWEYKEVDRGTGRQRRTTFNVPQLLDPAQPADWNYKHNNDEGEIIVCHPGKGQDRDIEFTADPTPDMVPLDDEAKAISASFAKRWNHPIESLPGTYGDQLLASLQAEAAKVQAKTAPAGPVEGMSDLLAAMATMMKQNQELLATLTKTSVPAAPAPGALKRA